MEKLGFKLSLKHELSELKKLSLNSLCSSVNLTQQKQPVDSHLKQVKSSSLCEAITKQSYISHKTDNQVRSRRSTSTGEVKLVSPYGSKCVYPGGDGSGGCIMSGPHRSIFYLQDRSSEIDSFESTTLTDTMDSKEDDTKSNGFRHGQLVWAKKPLSPWFPGIIVCLAEIENDTKNILKIVNASYPTKKELDSKKIAHEMVFKSDEKLHFVLFLNKNREWLWLPESKLIMFSKETDSAILEKAENFYTEKYKNEIYKAYKKARHFSSQFKN